MDSSRARAKRSRPYPPTCCRGLPEECEPIKINEATRWKPRSLEGKDPSKGDSGGPSSGPEVSKLSVDEVLRKANAVLNKVWRRWASFVVLGSGERSKGCPGGLSRVVPNTS